jgi:hypothetical protein
VDVEAAVRAGARAAELDPLAFLIGMRVFLDELGTESGFWVRAALREVVIVP